MFKTFHIKHFDFALVILVVALNLFGIYAIGRAAPSLQLRQAAGMIFSLIWMIFISMLDYRKVVNYYWVFYIINILILAMVLVIGSSGGGAQRWIYIGPVRFQPSEAAKILLILFYAKFIMKYKDKMKTFRMVIACLGLILPPLFLIYKEPDLSTSLMIFVIFFVVMFVGGLSYKVVGTILAITVPSVIIFLHLVDQEGNSGLLNGYQELRILSWLHPEEYQDTTSYQTMNSIMAIGSGQLTGKGQSTNEFSSLLSSGYISQSQTDFIFTVIGEELGFIGACSVVILLALVSIKCFLIARKARDTAGTIIAAGMGAWIGLQGFINMGVATGLLPNTGIPLPFVSYGLTSLLCLYTGIGFVLNVHMQNKQKTSISTNIQGAGDYL